MLPKYLFHPSTVALILINLSTILIALVEQWDVFVLLFLYVAQGLIIGFFHYFKVLRLKKIDVTNFKKNFTLEINGRQASVDGLSPSEAKKTAANFFITGFLGFNLVYLIFICAFIAATGNTTTLSNQGIFSIGFILLLLGYILTHGLSYTLSKDEINKKINLGSYVNEPLMRIFPIHLTIVIGGFFIANFNSQIYILLLFLILKTLFDVNSHIKQHEKNLTLNQ